MQRKQPSRYRSTTSSAAGHHKAHATRARPTTETASGCTTRPTYPPGALATPPAAAAPHGAIPAAAPHGQSSAVAATNITDLYPAPPASSPSPLSLQPAADELIMHGPGTYGPPAAATPSYEQSVPPPDPSLDIRFGSLGDIHVHDRSNESVEPAEGDDCSSAPNPAQAQASQAGHPAQEPRQMQAQSPLAQLFSRRPSGWSHPGATPLRPGVTNLCATAAQPTPFGTAPAGACGELRRAADDGADALHGGNNPTSSSRALDIFLHLPLCTPLCAQPVRATATQHACIWCDSAHIELHGRCGCHPDPRMRPSPVLRCTPATGRCRALRQPPDSTCMHARCRYALVHALPCCVLGVAVHSCIPGRPDTLKGHRNLTALSLRRRNPRVYDHVRI